MFGLPLSGTGEIHTTVWISTKIYHLQLWLDCQFCSVITLGVILLLFLTSLYNYFFLNFMNMLSWVYDLYPVLQKYERP